MKNDAKISVKPKVGRPTKYTPEYCEMIIDHMAKGLSKEAFAAEIGVSKQTLYSWTESNKEFLDAVHIGEMKSLYFWEKAGIRGMDMGTKFNAIVWKFNIANRFGWKDRQDVTSEEKPIIAGFTYIASPMQDITDNDCSETAS